MKEAGPIVPNMYASSQPLASKLICHANKAKMIKPPFFSREYTIIIHHLMDFRNFKVTLLLEISSKLLEFP